MNTTTEVKAKPKSPFAKKESDSQSLPTQNKYPLGIIEKRPAYRVDKPEWLGKRKREEDSGESEEEASDQEEDLASEEDVDMADQPHDEFLESLMQSVLKAFTTLRSTMFASICLALSQRSTRQGTPHSISLTSLQETQQLLAMVDKYLSDTSKSTSE